jgi:hypothetical protein
MRTHARQVQRPRHGRADAGGEHAAVLLGAVPAAPQYFVGASTAATILADRIAPALLDRYLAKTGYKSQQTGEREPRDKPGNLWAPADNPAGDDYGAHGEFDEKSHSRSAQLLLSHHPLAATAAGAAAAAAGAVLARQLRRK